MKKIGFRFMAALSMTMVIALGLTSCGDDDGGEPSFNEADYVGTYYGRHLISDPTLVSIIKGIDPDQDGSFADTIIASTGASTSDNIMDFQSALLGVTVQADFSKTSQNVIRKEFPLLVISDSLGVVVENAVIKQTSKITPSNGNQFVANFNLSGTLKTSTINFTIGNLATSGTFTK
jgi:hypothetical protein